MANHIRSRRRTRPGADWLAGVVGIALPALAAAQPGPVELLDLSIEELADLPVTAVSKTPERLGETAAAMQVITADEMRRSGAMSVAEALRLAPNLHVAQSNSHDWAISARGFNAAPAGNSLANKLLVLIDGRAVYTPLFGGVFWDVQNLHLADVARIEVVSGPGGTLWGSNAVNGVINVVTNPAADTQGWRVSAALGDFIDHTAVVRYGGALGANAHYRVYARQFTRGATELPTGADAGDEWRAAHAGFRFDLRPSSIDTLTVQGDVYDGTQGAPTTATVGGNNVLARWTRTATQGSELTLQVYYDRRARFLTLNAADLGAETLDADFQHRLELGPKVNFVWGAGYREVRDETTNSSFNPPSRDLGLASLFAQGDIALAPERVRLTVGAKLERNDFSGTEAQPRIQVAWTPTATRTLWGAVSRAVRSPSRLDRDILTSLSGLDAESLLAFELGHRWRSSDALALSAALFWNEYGHLRSINANANPPPSFVFANDQEASTRGVELSADAQLAQRWRLRAGYTYLHEHFRALSPLVIPLADEFEALDPKSRITLHTSIDLSQSLELDVLARYVDDLPVLSAAMIVPSYIAVDVRLAWRGDSWEAALVGRNLNDSAHREFTSLAIPRSMFATATWRF